MYDRYINDRERIKEHIKERIGSFKRLINRSLGLDHRLFVFTFNEFRLYFKKNLHLLVFVKIY